MDAVKSARESIVIETAAAALKQKRDKTHFAWQVYSDPKVAVVITHHNYSQFVEAAIDSVLGQTYGNFELIVVDDFSDTDHRTRLREILARKPAVKAIWNTTNIGQTSSFYRAFNVSDADFFCVLDPDDRYLPSFLEDMVSIHLNPYAYAGMACCDQLCIADGRQITGVYQWQKKGENTFRGVDVTAETMHTMRLYNWYEEKWPWTSTSSMMFRRSVVSLLHPHRDLDYKTEVDSYLANGARYLGFTIIFDRPLVFRSVHQNNSFRSSLVVHIFEKKGRPDWVDVLSDAQVDAIISILNNGGTSCMPWSHFKTILLHEFNIFQIARIRSQSEIAKKSLGQIELIAAKASQAAKLPWKKQILSAATAASRAAKLFWKKGESPRPQ